MALLREQMKQALARKNRQRQQPPGFRLMEAGAPPQAAGQVPAAGGETNATPEEQAIYERVVLGGMKVLYDEATHEHVMQFLDAADPASSLGKLVAMIIIEIDERNQGAMPETVVLPAAMELMDAAAELAEASGKFEVTPDIAENATHILVSTLAEHYGVDPQQMQQFLMENVPAEQLMPAGQEAVQNPARWRPFKDAPEAANDAPAPTDEEAAA